jgi:hypothetical protein
MSQSMKNCKYTLKLRLWVEFCDDFFGGEYIDIHQLSLKPLRSLQFLAKNPFKKCVFLHFLSNKSIINSFFGEKNITLRKRGRFYKLALYYFFIFLWFGNVS